MSDSSPAPADVAPADPATVEILRQLALPGARSLSPIDIARALAGEEAGEKWQKLLPAVRRAALALARDGRVEILRHGKPVDPAAPVRGVIRLRLPAGESQGA